MGVKPSERGAIYGLRVKSVPASLARFFLAVKHPHGRLVKVKVKVKQYRPVVRGPVNEITNPRGAPTTSKLRRDGTQEGHGRAKP